jgi:hypothetical protein
MCTSPWGSFHPPITPPCTRFRSKWPKNRSHVLVRAQNSPRFAGACPGLVPKITNYRFVPCRKVRPGRAPVWPIQKNPLFSCSVGESAPAGGALPPVPSFPPPKRNTLPGANPATLRPRIARFGPPSRELCAKTPPFHASVLGIRSYNRIYAKRTILRGAGKTKIMIK